MRTGMYERIYYLFNKCERHIFNFTCKTITFHYFVSCETYNSAITTVVVPRLNNWQTISTYKHIAILRTTIRNISYYFVFIGVFRQYDVMRSHKLMTISRD